MFFDQHAFDVRCEWGAAGLRQLAANSDAIVIVDVLSFSTCVDIAVGNGASVYPYRWQDASAVAYAHSLGALLASRRRPGTTGYSLSPTSLLRIPAATRLVLPSPNGATLSLATEHLPTFTGCLRNARAVAHALQRYGRRIGVVPAGEHWEDGSLRPALEDLLGAGAIIQHLPGTRSPEAAVAEATFRRFQTDITACLQQCGSGKELMSRGFARDVEVAAAMDQSDCAPILRAGAYVSTGDAAPSPHSAYERYNETAGAYDRTRTPVGLSLLIDCFRGSAVPLKHQRILDAGCGTGSYLYALKDMVGSLVGLDGSRAMLTQAAQKCGSAPNVTLEEGSILKLRFPDHAFDGVMINQVLHHLNAASDFQQLRQCVGEVCRVLKPTGALCINTCSREQLKAQGPIWYYTVFPEAAAFIAPRYIPVQQLCNILEEAGLVGVSVESRPEECFFAPEQYDDVEGPFSEAWRNGDSAFAVYRDTPAILAIRLQELRKSINDRSIYAIMAQSERLRERLGQYVVIVARKP